MQRVIGVVLCVGLVGCGGTTTREAKGVLTWEDGSPITGANVRFVSDDATKPEAVGFTDEKGEFSLQTQNKPGAVPGDYAVVVTKSGSVKVEGESPQDPKDLAKMMKAYSEKKGKAPPSEIPAVYATAQSTPLKNIKVDGSTRIELKVKKS